MNKVYDKNGREIMLYDTVKVFHFTGPRRKKFFMYKHVVGEKAVGNTRLLILSHLNSDGDTYSIVAENNVLADYEIVQGFVGGIFEDRPKLKPLTDEVK